jgi:hypothetical protein
MPAIPVEEWEEMWAPYDAPTYQLVLDQINARDIVLDIGAGDLRLTRQIAEKAKKVYALEQNSLLLEQSNYQIPANLEIIMGDARIIPFPKDISVAVLLMRHCTHFQMYFDKLRKCGCRRLLTNARWGMNLEVVDLQREGCNYHNFDIGWFACRCGNHGFKIGPTFLITETVTEHVWELESCPLCTA